jgi:hypothetical protein
MTAVLNSKNQGCVGQTATLKFGRFGRYKKGVVMIKIISRLVRFDK